MPSSEAVTAHNIPTTTTSRERQRESLVRIAYIQEDGSIMDNNMFSGPEFDSRVGQTS